MEVTLRVREECFFLLLNYRKFAGTLAWKNPQFALLFHVPNRGPLFLSPLPRLLRDIKLASIISSGAAFGETSWRSNTYIVPSASFFSLRWLFSNSCGCMNYRFGRTKAVPMPMISRAEIVLAAEQGFRTNHWACKQLHAGDEARVNVWRSQALIASLAFSSM